MICVIIIVCIIIIICVIIMICIIIMICVIIMICIIIMICVITTCRAQNKCLKWLAIYYIMYNFYIVSYSPIEKCNKFVLPTMAI